MLVLVLVVVLVLVLVLVAVLVEVALAADVEVPDDVDVDVEVVVTVAVDVAVGLDEAVVVAVVLVAGAASGAVILPAANPIPPITMAPSNNNTGFVPFFGTTIGSSSTASAGRALVSTISSTFFCGLTDFGGLSDFGFVVAGNVGGGTTDTAFGDTASSMSIDAS